MNQVVVNGFVKSALGVLSSELGATVKLGGVSAQADHYTTRGVTALVGVTGRLRGMVVFGLSEQTALEMVSHLMGQALEELDEMAQSGIAELGNVMVGSSLTTLAGEGYSCGLTPPALVLGSGTAIATPKMRRLVVDLLTPFGKVEMQLALVENGTH